MQEILRVLNKTFGNNCKLSSCKTITDSYKNTTYKLTCSDAREPLFLKVEKPFKIPRIQKFQIKKEVAGLTLCANAGIPVPQIISADEDWILLEFIDKNLIASEHSLSDDNRAQLGAEFEDIFVRISSIGGASYGDTFPGGVVGQHSSWSGALSKMTELLYEDGLELGIFGNNEHIVAQAIAKALSQIVTNSPPALFHCDLFSQNIMGTRKNGTVHISHVIDFGMSMFAPLVYSQYITWKFTDFAVTPIDICRKFGVTQEELIAYDILRIEPLVLAKIFEFDEYDIFTEYQQKCECYIK